MLPQERVLNKFFENLTLYGQIFTKVSNDIF